MEINSGNVIESNKINYFLNLGWMDGARSGRLEPIPGSVTDNIPWMAGCAFAPRCPRSGEDCVSSPSALEPDPLAPASSEHLLRCYHPVEEAR